MTHTIWLASYPKSGNTWLRMLIANLSAKDDGPVDINSRHLHPIASARAPFDDLLLIDSGLLTHDEIDCLRPRVYEALAHDAGDGADATPPQRPSVRFVKVHDAYMQAPNGEPMLAGARGAAGAIVIVRDPRDVAASLANHIGAGIDKAIAVMNDRDSGWCMGAKRQYDQLRQKLGGWSGHIASWLDQTDIPVHLMRYEDMLADTTAVFRRALDFAGCEASEAEIVGAVRYADFSELQRQEQDKGFVERPPVHSRGPFFRRGKAGGWQDELSAEQIARIEVAHAPMMRRLGYGLADWRPAARVG